MGVHLLMRVQNEMHTQGSCNVDVFHFQFRVTQSGWLLQRSERKSCAVRSTGLWKWKGVQYIYIYMYRACIDVKRTICIYTHKNLRWNLKLVEFQSISYYNVLFMFIYMSGWIYLGYPPEN